MEGTQDCAAFLSSGSFWRPWAPSWPRLAHDEAVGERPEVAMRWRPVSRLVESRHDPPQGAGQALRQVRPSHLRPGSPMRRRPLTPLYLAGASGQGSWRSAPAGPLVGVWWGLYLAAQITGTISARLALSESGVDTYLTAGWMGLASDALNVPAAIAAFLLVRTISRQQAAAREHPLATVFD